MSYNHLLIEDAGPATIITLNRPERRNALSRDTIAELRKAICEIRGTAILAANGPAFCSGHDLRELQAFSQTERERLFAECADFMMSLRDRTAATIAEVQGLATAAGCQLVAACDLAVASETAQFATPGVRIGVFCTTPAVPLVRSIGPRRAMEMLLTGAPVSARTALEWGLINRLAPSETLRDETLALARQISQGSAAAIAFGKRAVYEGAKTDEREAYRRASCVMVDNLADSDAEEGISAFLQRRTPVWPSAKHH